MGIGLQAIQLSPYHAGLAEQRRKRLLPFPALSACSCPLALSGSGEPLTQGSPLNPSHLRWGCCMTYCGAPEAGGSQVQRFVGPPLSPACPLAGCLRGRTALMTGGSRRFPASSNAIPYIASK